ncbi:MAG TPA: putative Ig domain-containing protein [Gammaproteobacteria bacterium]
MFEPGTAAPKCRLFAILFVGTLALSACGGDEDDAELAAVAENAPPALSGTPPTSVVAGSEYAFQPEASDADGDALLFGVDGLPPWAEFDSLTGRLSGAPGDEDVGTYRGIVVWVTDGEAETLLPAFDIAVTPAVADTNAAPTISGSPAESVLAGDRYRFVPQASDPDGDPLSFTIRNRPVWATFDPQSGTLEGTPPAASAGTFRDIVIAVSDGQATATLPPFAITVRLPTVNTPPTISGTPPGTVAAGTAYSFTPTADDIDGDTLTFTLQNGPGWATFDASTGSLEGTPDADDAGTYNGITISVSDGAASAKLGPFSIVVTAPSENQPPIISGFPARSVLQGQEYVFTPSASDADGDPLTFSIANRPSWASFDTATGRLSGRPDADDVGFSRLIVISVSDGKATAALPGFRIRVDAANTPPTISGSPATEVAQGQTYSFTPSATDADGDALTFAIQNRPSWATFDSATGRLSGRPGTGTAGRYENIVISVTDGTATASLTPFTITVTAPPNRAPTISGSPATSVQQGTPYDFAPTASDPDGDTLTFSIVNKPTWATFNASTGRLQGTPGAGHVGTHSNIRISVSDGQATASLPAFSITVTAAPPTNRAPTISGTPPTSATVGSAYSFTPSASDADGDTLTFSIANAPSWASFSTSTGRLQGTPGADDVGTYGNIRITVSDGTASASLAAFSITVTGTEPENRPPTISGTPPTTVVQGNAYSFRPTASDPDGDVLTFRIANQPSWANFDPSTGRLSGTPGANDVRTYSNIRISVTDGEAEVSLPAFSITVQGVASGTATLSWTPPTQRTDGSPLTNLAGFNIYWGTQRDALPKKASVGAGTTMYIVENLGPGTWYFAVTAFDSDDVESEFSNVASKTIQ